MDHKTQTLADTLRAIKAERAALTAADARLKEQQEQVEAELLASIPAELDAMSLTLPDGSSCTVRRKSSTRYSTAGGESDTYYAWVKQHNAIHFLNRAIKQDAIKEYQAQFNCLPPGIVAVVENGISFTVKKAKQELDI